MARFSLASISPRRRALYALVLALLAAVGWLHFTGSAATHGTAAEDMDWNGDGVVGQGEILQSLYAVTVRTTREGRRECHTYAWRSGGKTIRVDCRTTVAQAPPPAR